MKLEISLTRIVNVASLLSLIFFACFASAQAQVRPFVDCVERIDSQNYRAYFGYVNFGSGIVRYPIDSPSNFFTPIFDPPGQPTSFFPGVHHRAVSVAVPNEENETWFLGDDTATATSQTLLSCNDAGGNTRTITYQGRLTDTNAAANGQYDLRFQVFDTATDGAAQSTALALENVQVINGIFTVQLDFGILPAILDGGNLFLEIAVRPGVSTGAYATLAPRQPLTATPYAIRAQSAANADLLNGLTADKFVLKGTTVANATNAENATNAVNATNATNVSGGFVQLPLTTGAPPASECNAASQYGRQKVDAANDRLYICTANGWKFTTLQ